MATLSALISAKSSVSTASVITASRGVEELRNGAVFYQTVIDSQVRSGCWRAPGTGTAVIEIWGASGGGALGCCCGIGVPGNPGAYSKRTVTMTAGHFVCYCLGCSQQGTIFGIAQGRACATTACICTSTSSLMQADGGFGAFWGCFGICCLYNVGFCFNNSTYCCMTICNVGGPCSAVPATATGGDVNLSGGVSCVRVYDTCSYFPFCQEYTVAISPGVFSSSAPTCVKFFGQGCMYGATTFTPCNTDSNRVPLEISLNSMTGSIPQIYCCCSVSECSCYTGSNGCVGLNHGVPAPAPFVNGGSQGASGRGGHGAIKITFY